ncbi:MAG TPA: ribosome maturation factor RimM [Thiothrix sp.]|nr:ribosome maturation factor RimM [Thiothrix sp.]
MSQTIKLGHIMGVFGVKGWVKIYSHTAPRDSILTYSPWQLQKKGQPLQNYPVKQGQLHGKSLIAQLENVDNRNHAEALIGASIYIQRTQLPKLATQDYYWTDLEGLQVYNLQAIHLGTVDYLIETGANDVLIVKQSNGHEHLIPYIDAVVQQVDLQAKRLLVDWDADF